MFVLLVHSLPIVLHNKNENCLNNNDKVVLVKQSIMIDSHKP